MRNNSIFFKSIGARLTITFSIIAIIALLIIGIVINNSARNALEADAYNHLNSTGHLKSEQLITFLEAKFNELEVLTKSQNTSEAFNLLKAYHDSGGASPQGSYNITSNDYLNIYEEIDPFFKGYIKAFDYYDIFFICAAHGHVMYTADKESDLGTNLVTGEYRDSGLKKLWSQVKNTEKPAIVDISYYAASNEHALFLGAPVFDSNGKMLAIVALQESHDVIDEIMNNNTGLGETGVSYLVGQDYFMRSNLSKGTESTILTTKVETESVKMGLQHKEGTHLISNYNGVPVLSYYCDLGLDDTLETDFEWVLITEIDESEAFYATKQLSNKIIIIGLIIVLAIILVSLWITRLLTRPIVKLKEVSKKLENGDLTQEINIKRDDEIGSLADSFSNMQDNLRNQFMEIKEGANVLSSSSSEIMTTVSQLAASSAETATSVSETTSTIEEIKQTSEVSHQKAVEVADSGKKIALISQDGSKSVQKTIDGMKKIKQQMESIAGIVIQLSEKSQTIGEIAGTVSDLAEQSNLLAVNASIEAAKAGEQGKGFTVVAQEIKNLANRSKESTVQIRTILADIQKEISGAVMATEQGGKVIDEGLDLSNTANEVIVALAASVEQASQANLIIATSSQQQLVGMDQIASAMENIKNASMQNSASTKQTEESVSELNNLGELLLNLLNHYKLE